MPLQATSGAASYDAFGGGVPVVPNYIEDVMSTWLYTGNSGTQTITNGIDLSTKGGLVWIKQRASDRGHVLVDTVRGATKFLTTCNSAAVGNATDAQGTDTARVPSFTTSGFTLGADSATNSGSMVSWTFRKQPKFFDVVTYTGDGTSAQTVPHNLGSTPGMVIIKVTSEANDWIVWHRGLTSGYYLKLNTTAAQSNTNAIYFFGNGTTTVDPTSTVITLGGSGLVSGNGKTYVAYIFAHDAGGFGLTGTDNVISCGSVTLNGSGAGSVTLGYEPQWVLLKNSQAAENWQITDNMRGMPVGSADALLLPNSSAAESSYDDIDPTATGFNIKGLNSSQTYIYIAIRRGPMKVPTSGTSVFSPVTYTGNGTTQSITSGNAPLDLVWIKGRSPDPENPRIYDRLRGATKSIDSTSTAAETTRSDGLTAFTQTGFTVGSFGNENGSGSSIVSWNFKRAPSFFDEVCYTGTGVNGRSVSHNLAVAPELIIAKRRTATAGWFVYHSTIGTGQYLLLNSTGGPATDANMWGNTTPTSSNFYVGSSTNFSGFDYVSYLFSTCAGVSKVGSYTGTGSTLQVDCGFTSGARFVLIKRGDGSGDWYVWDSARGIVSGNDPYLLLNDTAAEVTNTDYIDTYSAGFEITASAPVNSVGDSFIFFAVA